MPGETLPAVCEWEDWLKLDMQTNVNASGRLRTGEDR